MPSNPSYFTTVQDYLRQVDQDRAALRRVASGDEDALGTLVDAYAPLLTAQASRMLWSVADAEEVVEEVFLELWKSPLSSAEVALCARLVAFTRERSLLRLRERGSRMLEHESAPSLRPAGALGLGPQVTKGSVLERAVKEIRGELQRALALAFYEGYRISEIAGVLSIEPEKALALVGDALLAVHHEVTVASVQGCTRGSEHPRSAAAYALGVLDAEAAERFRAHLDSPCSTCTADVAGFRETMAILPFLLQQPPVNPDVKERILFAIRLSRVAAADLAGSTEAGAEAAGAASAPITMPEVPGMTPSSAGTGHALPQRPWLTLLGVFAGLVVLVGLAAYVNTLIERVDEQATFIQDQESVVARLTIELDSRKAVLGIIESPDLMVVSLRGVGSGAGSHGKIFWDTGKHEGVLQVAHVGEPGPGDEFRLRVAWGGRDTAQIALMAIEDSDTSWSYFAVRGLPPPGPIEGVTLLRATRGEPGRETVVMQGVPAR